MLSYRHAFHAGNYADVIKHIVLVEILEYLIQKDKPFDFIDTHAGAGIYKLTSQAAQKNKEYENGIARLTHADWPELTTYLEIINRFNPAAPLQIYPGSPKIAATFLRTQDRAWLFELHTSDYDALQKIFAQQRNIRIQQNDGYQGLISLLPPKSKRALILIDPAYEGKADYTHVVEVMSKAYHRFATGIYAIWYPVIERRRVTAMEEAFVNSGMQRIVCFELGQRAISQTSRMHAAGMFVVNPPWPLFSKMSALLPKLAKVMTVAGKPHYRCEQLVGE